MVASTLLGGGRRSRVGPSGRSRGGIIKQERRKRVSRGLEVQLVASHQWANLGKLPDFPTLLLVNSVLVLLSWLPPFPASHSSILSSSIPFFFFAYSFLFLGPTALSISTNIFLTRVDPRLLNCRVGRDPEGSLVQPFACRGNPPTPLNIFQQVAAN